MPVHRRVAGALVIPVALWVAASALAAHPAKGAKFTGTASGTVQFATRFTANEPLSFRTSANGKKLLDFAYTDNVCTLAASDVIKVGTIKLGASGKLSLPALASAPQPDSTLDGGKVVTTTTISGRFVSATKVTGTLTYTQKETITTTHCGPIKLAFTATS